MSPNHTAVDVGSEGEVMAATDEVSDEFVIADIAREDAWLSVRTRDASVLADWA